MEELARSERTSIRFLASTIRPRDISRTSDYDVPRLALGPPRLQPFRLPPSSRPNLHGRRLADHQRPSADVTTTRRIEKHAAPRSKYCSPPRRPPLGLDHACVERVFTVYRCIRVTFSYVSDLPFHLDVCSPFHAFPFYFFTFTSSFAAPFLTTRSTSRTVRLFSQISGFRTPLFYRLRRRAACRRLYHLRVRIFTFSPLAHFSA